MTTVTKTVKFDAAHILTNHQGLCKNLHGHTYRVDVSVSMATDASEGNDMVIDFKDLKAVATETICDRFDHAFVYSTESEGEREIARSMACERSLCRSGPRRRILRGISSTRWRRRFPDSRP